MMTLQGRIHDLGGGMKVQRILPFMKKRTVGPFIFFDHMGPASFPVGQGMDVRPHPHIGLETVTYLFEGSILHRDNLGSRQLIEPGAINWMTAGRGIAHSERTPPESRIRGASIHGIQCWVALPKELEETEPQFTHYPAHVLPCFDLQGVRYRLLAGSALGHQSPVRVDADLFYLDAIAPAGTRIHLPGSEREQAVYVVDGQVQVPGQPIALEPFHLCIAAPGEALIVDTIKPSRLLLFGGKPLPEARHIWWNFVSSSKERIEKAKVDWREKRFAKVPGDEVEFIPLPGEGL